MDKTCPSCGGPMVKGPTCHPCVMRRIAASKRAADRFCKTCGRLIEGRQRAVATYCGRACKFADPELRAKLGPPRNRVIKRCPACKQDFEVPVSVAHRYNYCSKSCSNTRGLDGICERCGAPFRYTKARLSRFCCETCRRPPVTIICGVCGVEFRVTPSEESSRRNCSIRCYRLAVETNIEKAVRLALDEIGATYTQEAQIGPWVVDFLVTDCLVIEADGTYWHTKRPHVDKRKTDDLKARGYTVWRLPELYILRADFTQRLSRKWAKYQAAS